MQLYFIELPKLPNDKTELDQDLNAWVLYMNANNQQERQQIAANNPYIHEAQRLLEAMAQNPEERIQYEDRLKGLMDYHSGLGAARQAGMQAGANRIARNLLAQGMAIDTIAEVTGLTILEITLLRDQPT